MDSEPREFDPLGAGKTCETYKSEKREEQAAHHALSHLTPAAARKDTGGGLEVEDTEIIST